MKPMHEDLADACLLFCFFLILFFMGLFLLLPGTTRTQRTNVSGQTTENVALESFPLLNGSPADAAAAASVATLASSDTG